VSKFDPATGVTPVAGLILHGGNWRWQDRFCTVEIEPRVLMAFFPQISKPRGLMAFFPQILKPRVLMAYFPEILKPRF